MPTKTITTCDEGGSCRVTTQGETTTKELLPITTTVTTVVTDYCDEEQCEPITTTLTTVCPATLSTYTTVVSTSSNGEPCPPYTTEIVTKVPLTPVYPPEETKTITTVVSTSPNGEPCPPYTTEIVTKVPLTPVYPPEETKTITTVVSTSPNGEPCPPYTTVIVKPLEESIDATSILPSVIHTAAGVHISKSGEETTPSRGSSTARVDVDFEGKGANVKNPLLLILFSVLLLI